MQESFIPVSYNFAIIPHFKLLLKSIFLLSSLFLVSGCAQYKPGRAEVSHPLYRIIPRHRSQIKGYDAGHWATWMLFGNDDDGIFGECQKRPYRSGQRNTANKALVWWLRNPLHNFTYYTIGSANRVNGELTLLNIHRCGVSALQYTPIASRNYGGRGSSLFVALHGGKPYLSLRLKYTKKLVGEFYLGWRQRGNFGIKFHPIKSCKR